MGQRELTVIATNQFKRDYKLAMRRHLDIALLDDVVIKLANREPLPLKHRDHALHNNYEGFRECHIAPDWLLVYQIIDDILVLSLTRTGTHSDLNF